MSDQAGAVTSSATKIMTKSKKAQALPDGDFLVVTAFKVENLTEEQALGAAASLIESGGTSDFELGGILSKIQTEGWYKPHASFRKLVEDGYGLEYRKVLYLIDIYRNLVDKQIPWEPVSGLGWTKLMVLCAADVLTPENVEEWAEKAKHLSVLQLKDAIKALNTATAGEDGPDKTSSPTSNMTFKLHTDQKAMVRDALDKAKAELSTEFDTVALEGICVGYMGGASDIAKSVAPQKVSLVEVMKQHTVEEIMMAFEQVYPDVGVVVTLP